VTPDEPVIKVGAYLPVSRELLDDAHSLSDALDVAFDRWLRPWRYPDPNPMPHIVPFPRLERIAQRVNNIRQRDISEEDEW